MLEVGEIVAVINLTLMKYSYVEQIIFFFERVLPALCLRFVSFLLPSLKNIKQPDPFSVVYFST